MGKYISYITFRIFLFIFKLLPFWVVYKIADLLYFLLFRVTGYRKKVIVTNLKNSFPDKSDADINLIAKSAYKNLADIMVEGIKGASMNKKQIMDRYRFMNPELLDGCFESEQSVILVAGHYNNWEWAALSPPYFIKHHTVALYKKLHNKYLEDYMKRTRSHTGESLYELKETQLAFDKHVHANPPALFLLAADQSPSNTASGYWIDFLNQKTPCLHGPEKYARLYNMPIVYCCPIRKGRGKYELVLEWLVTDPNEFGDGQITLAFMHRLEKDILENPGSWLWSHKRWKHQYNGEEVVDNI
ncbi:lysophospholipid acyltransferase family protein [Portibacter lacus]|uniref:Acetyltransferase n=1 Tax=Portibacter lacus TaxID=1099794 RepID=A0AA37WEG0_9BACT|nr:lysophospholipid acyltransferase family protein [Portibacter lacus]GLR16724.1 acetyltransferase [Portibacter lacus]